MLARAGVFAKGLGCQEAGLLLIRYWALVKVELPSERGGVLGFIEIALTFPFQVDELGGV